MYARAVCVRQKCVRKYQGVHLHVTTSVHSCVRACDVDHRHARACTPPPPALGELVDGGRKPKELMSPGRGGVCTLALWCRAECSRCSSVVLTSCSEASTAVRSLRVGDSGCPSAQVALGGTSTRVFRATSGGAASGAQDGGADVAVLRCSSAVTLDSSSVMRADTLAMLRRRSLCNMSSRSCMSRLLSRSSATYRFRTHAPRTSPSPSHANDAAVSRSDPVHHQDRTRHVPGHRGRPWPWRAAWAEAQTTQWAAVAPPPRCATSAHPQTASAGSSFAQCVLLSLPCCSPSAQGAHARRPPAQTRTGAPLSMPLQPHPSVRHRRRGRGRRERRDKRGGRCQTQAHPTRTPVARKTFQWGLHPTPLRGTSHVVLRRGGATGCLRRRPTSLSGTALPMRGRGAHGGSGAGYHHCAVAPSPTPRPRERGGEYVALCLHPCAWACRW